MPIPNPNTTYYHPKNPDVPQEPADYGNVFTEEDLERTLAKIDAPVVSDRLQTQAPSPADGVLATDGQPVVKQPVTDGTAGDPAGTAAGGGTAGNGGWLARESVEPKPSVTVISGNLAVEPQDTVGSTGGTETGDRGTASYRYNWEQAANDGRYFREVVRDKDRKYWNDKDSNLNWAEIYTDYNRWAKDNGREPLDVLEWQAAMGEDNIALSPDDNEKERKRQKWNDAMDQAAYLLMNLGSFIGSVGGDAQMPAKNAPNSEELTKRQRLLRDATKKERIAYNKYLIEQLYKQKKEQRDAEVGLANKGLIQSRIDELKKESARKDALYKARIERENKYGDYYDAKTNEIKETTPVKVSNIKSQISARANKKSGSSGGSGKKGTYSNEYDTWQKNQKSYPEDTKAFMEQNGIGGYNKKSWSLQQIKQYNAFIRNKYPGGRTSSATRTKNDYSKYKVKK